MHPLAALILVLALVAASTVAGAVWRARQGRVRLTDADAVRRPAAPLDGIALGPAATLVQFSSEYCTQCRPTARVLEQLAAARAGVARVELDVARHPELVARLDILQTPTTLVLDRDGRVRARVGGAVRRDELAAELDRLLGASAAA